MEPSISPGIDFQKNPQNIRSKTSDRISYEAEVDIIRQQIGDIEDIRFRLGLSARKMAQLLLVDPSAWTRWTKKITPPPPHIYRALQWYLTLQEKNPGFTPQVFLASHWHSSQINNHSKRNDLLIEIEGLKKRIHFLEENKPQKIGKTISRLKMGVWLVVGVVIGIFMTRFGL